MNNEVALDTLASSTMFLGAGMLLFLCIFSFAILIVGIVALFGIFQKAGIAGWKALVPIYNNYLLCKVAFGQNYGWLFIFYFIPIASTVFPFVLEFQLCKAFGKDTIFAILSLFFSPITRLILAFGESEHLATRRW